MVPTDHDITFSMSFDVPFSRTFLLHASICEKKNDQIWTFQIRHIETTIWSWVCQKNGEIGYVCSPFLDLMIRCIMVMIQSKTILIERGSGSYPRKIFNRIITKSCNSRQFWRVLAWLLCHNKSTDCPFWNRPIHWNTEYRHKYQQVTLGKEGYDNNCSRIKYEQEELEKYLICKQRRAERAECFFVFLFFLFFFFEKLALVPINSPYPFKLSVQNTQNKKFKDYQFKFQGRSPKCKDFSRTNSFSRSFQGKPKIQGVFKDCGNPELKPKGNAVINSQYNFNQF